MKVIHAECIEKMPTRKGLLMCIYVQQPNYSDYPLSPLLRLTPRILTKIHIT